MRWACTELTLGLKETCSGEIERWHAQSAINEIAVSVQLTMMRKCRYSQTILSYRGTPRDELAMHGTQIKTGGNYITQTTSTDPQSIRRDSHQSFAILSCHFQSRPSRVILMGCSGNRQDRLTEPHFPIKVNNLADDRVYSPGDQARRKLITYNFRATWIRVCTV